MPAVKVKKGDVLHVFDAVHLLGPAGFVYQGGGEWQVSLEGAEGGCFIVMAIAIFGSKIYLSNATWEAHVPVPNYVRVWEGKET